MKKIIILVLITLMLTGCKTKTYKTNNEVYWDKFIISDEKKEAQNGNPMLLVKVLNHPLTFKNIITETTKGVKI